jgi:hypothetical protein
MDAPCGVGAFVKAQSAPRSWMNRIEFRQQNHAFLLVRVRARNDGEARVRLAQIIG